MQFGISSNRHFYSFYQFLHQPHSILTLIRIVLSTIIPKKGILTSFIQLLLLMQNDLSQFKRSSSCFTNDIDQTDCADGILPQWKLWWSDHDQKADWSSMLHNRLLKVPSCPPFSSLGHCVSGLEELWKSWSMSPGLTGWKKVELWWGCSGLLSTDCLEISKLISELFSLLLLQDPSVSLLRLMRSDGSLPLRAMICNSHSSWFRS